MSGRRLFSTKLRRAIAREVPKSIELEQRIARIELTLNEFQSTLTTLTNRVIAVQAHLDHLEARLRGV